MHFSTIMFFLTFNRKIHLVNVRSLQKVNRPYSAFSSQMHAMTKTFITLLLFKNTQTPSYQYCCLCAQLQAASLLAQ